MADEPVAVARVSMPDPPKTPVNGDGETPDCQEGVIAVKEFGNDKISEDVSPKQLVATNGHASSQQALSENIASHEVVGCNEGTSEQKQASTTGEKKSNGTSTPAASTG
jgi:hypothetical protein